MIYILQVLGGGGTVEDVGKEASRVLTF